MASFMMVPRALYLVILVLRINLVKLAVVVLRPIPSNYKCWVSWTKLANPLAHPTKVWINNVNACQTSMSSARRGGPDARDAHLHLVSPWPWLWSSPSFIIHVLFLFHLSNASLSWSVLRFLVLQSKASVSSLHHPWFITHGLFA
jgi:hypothetical protein